MDDDADNCPNPTAAVRVASARPPSSSAADEVDDFDLVALVDHRRLVAVTFDDHDVVLDRDAAGIDVELREQRADRERAGDLVTVPVQLYRQSLSQRLPTPNSRASSRVQSVFAVVDQVSAAA